MMKFQLCWHQASEYQTTTVVESLISQGSGVNAKDEQGITPLMQVVVIHSMMWNLMWNTMCR